MKVDAFLSALRRMPLATPRAVTKGEPFIVLSPHPDDESLGVGGLIAAACAVGQSVDVVVLTDGSGSHRHSKTHPREALIALREEEAALAAAELGLAPERLTHLGLPDARMPPDGPAFEAAIDGLERRIEASKAQSLFVTWGHDPHCDHEAADRMARELRRRRPSLTLWSYPIWGWHLPPDGEVEAPAPAGFRVDIAPWRAAKRRAIAAHASQMTDLINDDPEGFRFDERTIAPFLGPYDYVLRGTGMTRRQGTMPPGYFEGLYAATPDPWHFASSPYEREKYNATLAALGQPHYRAALEIGCSIGIFTDRLAPRCEALLAIDASEIALNAARALCTRHRNVTFAARMVPEGFPVGRFDLIVLSEVLYYLDRGDLDRLAAQCLEALTQGGEIVLCHWLGETDYPLTGAQAHDLFVAATADRLAVETMIKDDVYRLSRLSAT